MYFIFFILSLMPLAVFAQANDVVLPDVIVIDSADKNAAGFGDDNVSVIKIESVESRSANLEEVLSRQVGLHVTRLGGPESMGTLSIRGSSADDVGVTLDGIPLTQANGRKSDLSLFSLDQFESVAVYKGLAPLSSHSTSSAGLVELKSKKIRDGEQGTFSFEYGSFNSYKANGSFSKGGKSDDFLVSASFGHSDGDFSFVDDNGTPANLSDDARVGRNNNDSNQINVLAKWKHEFDKNVAVSSSVMVAQQKRGVPGFSSNQSSVANVAETSVLGQINVERKNFIATHLTGEFNTYVRVSKTQYEDKLGEIGLGGAQDNDDDGLLFGERFSFKWPWSSFQLWSASLAYEFENYRPENFLATPSDGTVSFRHKLIQSLEDQIELFGGRLVVTAGGSFEHVYNRLSDNDPSLATAGFLNSSADHNLSGRLNLKYKLSDSLTLHSQVGRAVREPFFNELFGDRGGLVGNTFLQPEKSFMTDFGFTFEGKSKKTLCDRIRFDVTGYDRHITNLVQFVQNSGFARAENLGRAHLYGIEVQLLYKPVKSLTFTGNYTFQKARDTVLSLYLPGRPQHELSSQLEYEWRQFSAFTGLEWMDSNFLDRLNTRKVNDRILVGAGVGYRPTKKVSLSVEGKNLGNDQVVDVVGFPLPGRSVMGKIGFKL